MESISSANYPLGGVHTVPVIFSPPPSPSASACPSASPSGVPNEEALEAAYSSALARGSPPKALLLTNPSNPSGEVYSAAQLRLLLRWAVAKDLHVIADEIYALSVCPEGEGEEHEDKDGNKFESVASVLQGDLGG